MRNMNSRINTVEKQLSLAGRFLLHGPILKHTLIFARSKTRSEFVHAVSFRGIFWQL
jgi:hypothetical protein